MKKMHVVYVRVRVLRENGEGRKKMKERKRGEEEKE
jgi:hypothetical protein